MRVMDRLNLTLDESTSGALDRHARREGKPRAALARELIREAIAQREALERERKLARDYAAGRSDARQLLQDLEAAQLELLDDEEA
jgi:metal-responsive CopG/Arc/MetJ family transcriptional regulator